MGEVETNNKEVLDKLAEMSKDVKTLCNLLIGDVENPNTPGYLERVRAVEQRVNAIDEYMKGEKETRQFYSRLVMGALITNLLGIIFFIIFNFVPHS